MSEKSLWVKLNKREVKIKDEVLRGLQEQFATKQIKARQQETVEGKPSKKEKELKVCIYYNNK